MSAPSITGARAFAFEDIGAFERIDAAADQAAQAQADGEQERWTTIYPGVEQFVREVFAPTFVRRTTADFRWCPQWWRHPEAIMRMEALWRTWEVLRRDPQSGMALWLREHADHHLPILTGAAGPFAECDPREHFDSNPSELPTAPAPENWWPPQDQDDQGEEEDDPAAEQHQEERDEQPQSAAEQDEGGDDQAQEQGWPVEVDPEQQRGAASTHGSPDHQPMEA